MLLLAARPAGCSGARSLEGPRPAVPFRIPGFTDFRLRVDMQTLFSRRLCLPSGRIKPRTAVPVRVTGRIVAILAGKARIAAVVQIRKPPRAAHPGGVRAIESRSRACIPSNYFNFCKGSKGALPLWTAYAVHSPRFLPDPQSRGRPLQYALPGAPLPLPQARPA